MEVGKWLDEWCDTNDYEVVVLEPRAMFDKALLGAVEVGGEYVACYDAERCLSLLIEDGMDRDDALEHFDFNVAGSCVAEGMPVFLYRPGD